jgi:hypothetical protein
MTSTTKQRDKNEAKRAKAALEAKSIQHAMASVRVDPRRITLAKLKFMGERVE